MIEFRKIEKTINGDKEGAYLGLPGERFQETPDVTVSVPQYREGWYCASSKGVLWNEWRDIDFTKAP